MRTLTIILSVAGVLLVMLPRPSQAVLICDGGSVLGLPSGAPAVTATPMVFGAYMASLGTPTTITNTITVACVGAALNLLPYLPAFTITLSAGSSSSFSPRKFTGPSTALSYNIYTTAAMTAVWGNGTGGSVTQAGGNNLFASQTFTGYGSIPKGQWVKAGSYTDTITITVTY
ncbi:spore coat protein U domain-containing protein [Acidisoma silvae]|uniref:Spore coat protein U domain-containing protein n=1 Tax=Acidisoma silvae TaxID=2802396 RepID=A0A964E176_9PROT|nr:spore coat protein U domain-containing protein [Acidisoma silvae]MCB8878295.1 spore coat protein U domain-containing protein [Acidisoma silvae]